ncbi:MAG: class I SAM-dependent methyltransferase [Vicinamibacterales bacterium]
MKVPELSRTRRFYEDLTTGRESRGLWGYEKRFDPTRIPAKPSVQRHFTAVVAEWLRPGDRVLDLGCGPGGFLLAAAPHCRAIVGVDIVPAFVERCREAIAEAGVSHAEAHLSADGLIPCETESFDAVIMVDAIHHCDDPAAVLADVHRVLKPGGRFLIFEPNKGNPLLAAMCCVDRNEWGLLQLGSHRAYRRLLSPRFDIATSVYSGLLVGPDGRASRAIADTVSAAPWSAAFGWLSPKIFVAARRKA